MFDFFGKKKKEALKQSKAVEANNYVVSIQENKGLPSINTSIFLDSGETAYLEEPTTLLETRAIRKYSSSGGGVGFRIAKGVYVGRGGRTGTSESHQEWRAIDKGKVIITNKRIIFDGEQENRSIKIADVLSASISVDAVELSLSNKSKSVIFSVNNGYIWGTIINIIKKVEDPSNIGDLKLDIQFQ